MNFKGRVFRLPQLFDIKQQRIRILHFTWIAFFITFFVWFNMAPLATTMLKHVEWLTKEHIKILTICNVALTIPARIAIGALIDRYGPRVIFSLLMMVMAIPALLFAFGNTFIQLLVSRLVLGSIGAGFVIGIRMVAQWFPPEMMGRAEGLYAGWGNFGSAVASMTLPWVAVVFFDDWLGLGANSWRYALAMNGIVCFLYGVLYYFLVQDLPSGEKFKGTNRADPMLVTSYKDLALYIGWSFPLVAAMGLLVWRISNIRIHGEAVLEPAYILAIYIFLGFLYIIHIIKVLWINLPYLKSHIPESEKYNWGNVAALNSTYFANFGSELAVVSMLPMFFESTFQGLTNGSGNLIMTAALAGVIASSFAFVNLFARPLGGYISDIMTNRKKTMLIYMFGIALGFLLMSFIGTTGAADAEGNLTTLPYFRGSGWLIVSILITILCSVFVQGAEGATFAIIPLINPKMTGQIAGMAGAYGNVGATFYLVIYSLVDAVTFFYILSAGAALSFVYCYLFLEVPDKK
jgi:MFS transporter, NNP family, nitrate/nitrite transporter